MQMSAPLVSVIIPCYNQGLYLAEALDSLISQTFTDWEAIIVNDGSIDNTEEIANVYVKKDSRIKYIYQENAGPSSARNNGIKSSKSRYIIPLDEDDKLAPTYIEKAINFLEANNDYCLFYTAALSFGSINGVINVPAYSNYKDLLAHNRIFNTSVYRRKDYDNTTGYDETLRIGLEDWEFYLRLLYPNKKVKYCCEALYMYRHVNGAKTRTQDVIKCENTIIWDIFTRHKDKIFEYYGNPLENVLSYDWTSRTFVQFAYYWTKRYDHFKQKWIKRLKI